MVYFKSKDAIELKTINKIDKYVEPLIANGRQKLGGLGVFDFKFNDVIWKPKNIEYFSGIYRNVVRTREKIST